jgi:hypothetical protein
VALTAVLYTALVQELLPLEVGKKWKGDLIYTCYRYVCLIAWPKLEGLIHWSLNYRNNRIFVSMKTDAVEAR